MADALGAVNAQGVSVNVKLPKSAFFRHFFPDAEKIYHYAYMRTSKISQSDFEFGAHWVLISDFLIVWQGSQLA